MNFKSGVPKQDKHTDQKQNKTKMPKKKNPNNNNKNKYRWIIFCYGYLVALLEISIS